MSLYTEEADDEWQKARREHLLRLVREQRPARLSVPGQLQDDVSRWGDRLVAGDAGNLLLAGPTGAGKTWTAWEVLEQSVKAGYDGRWIFADSATWQDTISPPVDRERLQAMRDVDLLVLDDLGSSRVNEWQRECLLGVVDQRWANERPIVITFNASSLREMLGERIASRLAHGHTAVVLDGDDRRRS